MATAQCHSWRIAVYVRSRLYGLSNPKQDSKASGAGAVGDEDGAGLRC
jgi:hypothetical protein